MGYLTLSDLAQTTPAETTGSTVTGAATASGTSALDTPAVTKAEYDRMLEIEAVGVPHDVAKQMIYDARKTGKLPEVPKGSWVSTGLKLAAFAAGSAAVATGIAYLMNKKKSESVSEWAERTGALSIR